MTIKKQATIGTVIGFIILIGLFFGFGDYLKTPPFGNKVTEIKKELKLKAPKEKILDYREKTIYHRELVLGSDIASSTISQYVLVPETFIEYDYISDIVTNRVPYYDNEDDNFSNAEYLETRVDGKTSIAFYSEDLWAKDENGIIFEIVKNATTTVEAFAEQTKITLLEKLKSYFARSALAIDTYNSSGTYTPPSSGTVETLVIAGGGGGGCGGGGAGGVIYTASSAVTAQEYTVTVGAGGGGSTVWGGSGSVGNNSVFGAIITATGGGLGSHNTTGGTGGSGGGGGYNSTGGSGTAGQGNDGGDGLTAGGPGGGGGGKGVAGSDTPTATTGGDGGNGSAYSISGSSVTYGGGGGGFGGEPAGGTGGSGGTGGGGAGATGYNVGTAGTANTGGGGGGGYTKGGAGGSGIVIIVFSAAATDTCTPTLDGLWAMDLQDHCTTTESTYSDYGMECYNPVGGSWVIGANTEVRRGSSTNCLPQIEGTGVFSIQPIH